MVDINNHTNTLELTPRRDKNKPDLNQLPPASAESRSIAAFKSQLSD